MSKLYERIVQGFKEIGEYENNKELVDLANSLLEQEKQKKAKRKRSKK